MPPKLLFATRLGYDIIDKRRFAELGAMFTISILTVSDKGSQGKREDKSGEAIREIVSQMDARVVDYAIVPDERDIIAKKLAGWADSGKVDMVITTGGTGLAPRDVTPEATLDVVDRIAPGFAEVMRAESLKKTPRAMLSRAVAGIRKKTLIINLPGSPKAVRECLEVIMPALPHAVETLGVKHRNAPRPQRWLRGRWGGETNAHRYSDPVSQHVQRALRRKHRQTSDRQ